MVRIGRTILCVLGILWVAGAVRAETLAPGLEVRAWQNTPYDLSTPLLLDGARFDRLTPTPAPNDSTAGGTLGYMTLPIHVNPTMTEWFFSGGGPVPQIGYIDTFAVEYRGKLLVPAAGNYRFSTTSDDGSVLWIDPSSPNPSYSSAAVQNNYIQGMMLRSSDAIPLTAGYHDLIVRLSEVAGGAGLYVQWDTAGGTNFTDIPDTQFFHEAVPEPSTVGLLASGLVGLLAFAYRRKRTAY